MTFFPKLVSQNDHRIIKSAKNLCTIPCNIVLGQKKRDFTMFSGHKLRFSRISIICDDFSDFWRIFEKKLLKLFHKPSKMARRPQKNRCDAFETHLICFCGSFFCETCVFLPQNRKCTESPKNGKSHFLRKMRAEIFLNLANMKVRSKTFQMSLFLYF